MGGYTLKKKPPKKTRTEACNTNPTEPFDKTHDPIPGGIYNTSSSTSVVTLCVATSHPGPQKLPRIRLRNLTVSVSCDPASSTIVIHIPLGLVDHLLIQAVHLPNLFLYSCHLMSKCQHVQLDGISQNRCKGIPHCFQ